MNGEGIEEGAKKRGILKIWAMIYDPKARTHRFHRDSCKCPPLANKSNGHCTDLKESANPAAKVSDHLVQYASRVRHQEPSLTAREDPALALCPNSGRSSLSPCMNSCGDTRWKSYWCCRGCPMIQQHGYLSLQQRVFDK
jgi:hypothetical protein